MLDILRHECLRILSTYARVCVQRRVFRLVQLKNVFLGLNYLIVGGDIVAEFFGKFDNGVQSVVERNNL